MKHSQHRTDRWLDRRRRSSQDEKGLALLDVLIGIAIFALIAIIAVTAISQYRARAYESGTVSDAQQAGVAAEAFHIDNGFYPSPLDLETDFENLGVNFTEGNQVVFLDRTETSFTFCVQHPASGSYAVYDTDAGGVTVSGRSGGC